MSSSRALASTNSLLQSPSSKSHTVSTAHEFNTPGSSLTPSKFAATASSVLPKLDLTPFKTPFSSQRGAKPSQSPSSVGKWQHPRLNEVLRRQNKSAFDEKNVRAAIINSLLAVSCLVSPHVVISRSPSSIQTLTEPYLSYTLYALSLYFLSNLALAIAPRWQPVDACEDIPLTPSQRKLLGLPPMSRPATPQEKEQWVTPPRYSRSTTPRREGSPGMFFDVSGRESPLSGTATGSPLNNSFRMSGAGGESSYPGGSSRRDSGSPFSPSPLKEKMLRGGLERRRSSFGAGNGSTYGSGEFDGYGVGRFDTPSKKGGLGLNNKWLYEKGRGSPSASRSSLL